MTLLLEALVIATGVFLGRIVARALRTDAAQPGAAAGGGGATVESAFERFHCKLGDVIVRTAERDEAWLAGALLFSEQSPIAALFVAPEAVADRGIYVRAGAPQIAWLAAVSGVAIPSGDPPSAIEQGGAPYERRRRIPVRVERLGTGAPIVGDRAIIAEYDGPGDACLVLVAGAAATLVFCGSRLSEGDYDVLPGDASTLE